MPSQDLELLRAIFDDRLENTKKLWQGVSLTPLDHAKVLYYALFYHREGISLWILGCSDVIAPTGEALLRQVNGSFYKPYWDLLLSCCTVVGPDKKGRVVPPNAAVIRAAIKARVPCGMHDDMHRMFNSLCCLGGPGLVFDALDAGYDLEAPKPCWLERPNNCRYLDKALITGLAERGFPAYRIAEMKMFHAVSKKDKKSLKSAVDDALHHPNETSRAEYLSVLRFALRAGWVEGARLLMNRLNLCVPGQPSGSILYAAVNVEGSSRGCLRLLLKLGRQWQEEAFFVAFRSGRFSALEQVVEQGVEWFLGPPGTLMARLPAVCAWRLHRWYQSGLKWPTGSCLAASHLVPTHQMTGHANTVDRTVETPLTACVLALVHAAKAGPGPLASEIRCWRQPACLLVQWWDQESRAHSLRPGGTASTYLPDILARIMEQAVIFTPRDFQRAIGVAAKLCNHMQIAFPTQT